MDENLLLCNQRIELCLKKHILMILKKKLNKNLPRISLTVPSNVLANDRGRIIRAILNISSSETFPSCLTK